jgi:hypothetical protein
MKNYKINKSIIASCQNQIAHFVEGSSIAAKAGLSFILLEMAKLMWNALLPMLDASYNRSKIIDPMIKLHGFLKESKENSDPDFLVLYYHGLFT